MGFSCWGIRKWGEGRINKNNLLSPDWKEGVGCGVWGVEKETSFLCGGENFFIGTDSPDS